MKKGFTLIELLAVIVILSIIALISVPLVLNTIEKAQKGALKDSAYGILKAAEIKYAEMHLTNSDVTGVYVFNGTDFINGTNKIDYKGGKPVKGELEIKDQDNITIAIWDGKWCFTGKIGEDLTETETNNENDCTIIPPDECLLGVTDSRDGNYYPAVRIGSQCWFAKNLAYLPNVNHSTTQSTTTPYYYVYDYQGTDVSAAKSTLNYIDKGVLYNYAAATNNDPTESTQGACPSGWHLPSDSEFKTLEASLGMTQIEIDKTGVYRGTVEGDNLKITGSSGFDGVFSGYKDSFGSFLSIGTHLQFWLSGDTYRRVLMSTNSGIFRDNFNQESVALSVRCIKD